MVETDGEQRREGEREKKLMPITDTKRLTYDL
jgi:hypothetical protein